MRTEIKIIGVVVAGAVMALIVGFVAAQKITDSGAKCPATRMVNETEPPEEWDDFDMAKLEIAKAGCIARYGDAGECVSLFIKYHHDSYGVGCSPREVLADGEETK